MGTMKAQNICYTIGHSNHTAAEFIYLLKKYGITHLVDVRSVPYSKYASQFNMEQLLALVKAYGIQYLFMGKELGARFNLDKFRDHSGQLDFDSIIRREEFCDGISRIINGINLGAVIAIMCSEKEPFNCHRFSLVSYALRKQEVKVNHILADGSKICNSIMEDQLIEKYYPNYGQLDLFTTNLNREDVLHEAYVQRYRDIAYSGDGSEV